MKKKAVTVFLALFALIPLASMANGEDLQNCTYSNGKPMTPKLCEGFRRIAIKDAAEAARVLELEAASREKEKLWQEKQAQLKIESDKKAAEEKRRWDEEQAVKKAELDKYLADQQRQEDQEAARDRKINEARRKACGEDFGNPRIGMSIQRAQQCVADFKLKGQINRSDGVVSTYTAGRAYAHVMDGKIVSWGK